MGRVGGHLEILACLGRWRKEPATRLPEAEGKSRNLEPHACLSPTVSSFVSTEGRFSHRGVGGTDVPAHNFQVVQVFNRGLYISR